MFKNLTQLYAISVCLISILILMINLGSALSSISDIIATKYKYYESLNNYSTNDKYIKYIEKKFTSQDNKYNLISFTDEQIKKKRLEEKENFIDKIYYTSIASIINNMIWILLMTVFFTIHWRVHKKYS